MTNNLRKVTLSLALFICTGIAFSIMSWANEPIRTYVHQDIRLSEINKAIDLLEQLDIGFKVDARGIISVEEKHRAEVMAAFTSAGLYTKANADEVAAAKIAAMNAAIEQDFKPVFQQEWFARMLRLAMATCVIIVLIFRVIAPIVQSVIHGKKDDEWQDEAFIDNDPSATDALEPVVSVKSKEVELFHQVILGVILLGCIGVAFGIVFWAKSPDFRPLINDVRQIDAVKTFDVLEQHGIRYRHETAPPLLLVEDKRWLEARLLLAKNGITTNLPEYQSLAKEWRKKHYDGKPAPWYESPEINKMVKLLCATLLISVLIIFLMKPLLRWMLYREFD